MEGSIKIRYLPDEITMEILSRLPVKTILGCHRVCKSWRNILLHPAFAKLHVTKSPANLLQRYSCNKNLVLVDLESPGRIKRSFDFISDISCSLSDSCNGFLLVSSVYDAKKIYILNPLTGDYITIPQCHPYYENLWTHTRFGFCPKSNQYKVLQITFTTASLWEVDIYTLGSGCWRSLGLFDEKVMHHAYRWYEIDALLNGCLHWLVGDIDTTSDFIFSFDLENETLQPIPPPFQLLTQKHNLRQEIMRLGVLDSCLSIVDHPDPNQDHCDIWVLKEYGVQASWTIRFVIQIPNYGGWISQKYWFSYLPVKLLNNDDEILLLHKDKKLVRYNFREKQFKDSLIFESGIPREVVSHVPSFLKFEDIGLTKKLEVMNARASN